jgi:glycine betaine/proline transport system substrate-binding protein
MGQATWDTGWFQAQVFKLLLEDLGYEVREPETLDTIAFYFFAAQGDVDFWANGWFPLHSRYFDYRQVAGEIEAIGFQVEGGALQGYMVDKATAEELGITNLGDLQDPDIAAAFDSDGDGKANLICCKVGWGCERVIDHHLNAYGLQDTVTHVKSDYSALMADTVSRYQDGQPVLFYTWTPNWTVSELVIGEDVAWLGVPFSSLPDDLDADTGADSISGCLESPCDMGFGPNDIRVVANVDFLEENPAAATLFNLVEIPLEDIAAQNSLMRAGENTEEDIRRHAQAWIEANHDQIARWLAAARDAAE